MLEVRLLGQFDVRRDGERVDIPSRPSQSLLAYLLLRANVPQRREMLAGIFWPDATETSARNNLRHSLWRIRKAIGESHLEADNISVALMESSDLWVDAWELDRPWSGETPLAALTASAQTYGGDLLPGFYEDWVVLDRERMRVAFERRVHGLVDRLLEASSWREAVEWAERWIVLGHSPEAAFRAMMVAHSGLGDMAAVAAAFRRCTEMLQRDLGVEVSAKTRETYQRLTRGEKLGPPPAVRESPETHAPVDSLRSLLRRWREERVEVLDLPRLAMMYAWPSDIPMLREEAALILRSALHHGADWQPWMRAAGSDEERAGLLLDHYKSHPPASVRLRIAESLRGLAAPAGREALVTILETDDAADVTEAAALGLAAHGEAGAASAALARRDPRGSDGAGVQAAVALADVLDRPMRARPRSSVPLPVLVALRRWRAAQAAVFGQALRAGLGAGLLTAINGLLSPWYASLAWPEGYQEVLEFVSIPTWMIGGALGFLVIGGLQGISTALAVGIADACWRRTKRARLRVILAALSGLVHTAFLLLATSSSLTAPASPPAVYIPGSLAYGLVLGAALGPVIPPPQSGREWKSHISLAVRSAAILGAATLAFGALVHVEEAVGEVARRLTFALLLPFGIALGTRRSVPLRESPRAVPLADASARTGGQVP
jgi:DNA-binding SARP family transcriptional activator